MQSEHLNLLQGVKTRGGFANIVIFKGGLKKENIRLKNLKKRFF